MNSIRFEEDYIFRNNRSITMSPDVALTELVANAWDAGAFNVSIIIPRAEEETISVMDDGIGMTDEEFHDRWMTLNYNREKHQGKYVSFPEGVNAGDKSRLAYGRNGVGRHGMLCFANQYVVETWKNGNGHKYTISISAGEAPYSIVSEKAIRREGHGTEISAIVKRNLPDISNIREILSARFIYDPQFILKINGEEVNLASSEDVIQQIGVITDDGGKLDIAIVDSTKTANLSRWHGVAFWVRGRLVGNPSWSYGNYQFLDARYKIAKRYTIIVQSNDDFLINDVYPDWTGFFETPKMDDVYKTVSKVVNELVSDLMIDTVSELKKGLIEEKRDDLERLSVADIREVSSFMDVITSKNPLITAEMLHASVDALMQIQQAKRGTELLSKLSSMSTTDLDKLAELLDDWEINDIVSVIDEIDSRITVVEAISRLYDDKATDELHTLHPMVLNARWLFGAEYDSPMFTSNRALSTVIKTLFKEEEYDVKAITNTKKRPDIICLKKSSISAVCTDRVDYETGEIMKPDQVLIIELKRGGYEIGGKEIFQAENYVHQIKKTGILHKASNIHAFVVGARIGDIAPHIETNDGIIDAVSYGQLIQTATSKLFGLKKKLEDHYDKIDDKSMVERALMEPRQMKLSDYNG